MEKIERKRFTELYDVAQLFTKLQLSVTENEVNSSQTSFERMNGITTDMEMKYFITLSTGGDISKLDDALTPRLTGSKVSYIKKLVSPENQKEMELEFRLKTTSHHVKEILESDQKFNDPEFEPSHSSIVGLQTVTMRLDLPWKRAPEISKALKFFY